MESYFKGRKVGIWGFGAVGKSVLSFLSQFNCQISVLDQAELDGAQKALIEGHRAQLVPAELLFQFLEMNEIIIPSPGINLNPYKDFEKKWLSELDIFHLSLSQKITTIAITGSVGKTTVTHILTHLLNKLGKRALAAGNIGLPLLDAIGRQNDYDFLVVELSSFQLQKSKLFAPDLALITNFYPNHLDHHEDIQEYLTAKGQLLINQMSSQLAIIPMTFMDEFWPFIAQQKVDWLAPDLNIDRTKELSDITCHQNWQLIIAALEQLQLSTKNLQALCDDLPKLPDRIEFVGTVNGVTFYNDSKATIPEATLTAVKQFEDKHPFLFLGGLSKGVDRSSMIKELQGKVKHIFCFGADAGALQELCQLSKIESSQHQTLEDAFEYCIKKTQPNDLVLFSPAGSSFDLFKDYVERGKRFSSLVIK